MSNNLLINIDFLSSTQGQRLCLICSPADASTIKGLVLIVPPFVEEMNKSRRMLSSISKILAKKGYFVVLPDLCGTGDSAGLLSDVSWGKWFDDLALCTSTFKQYADISLNILAMRCGALLAIDYIANKSTEVDKLVLWHPVLSGDQWLTQFLRLRLAASMAAGAKSEETVKDLKQILKNGGTVEVAGYEIGGELSKALMERKLEALSVEGCKEIYWLELITNERKTFTIASKKLIEQLQSNKKIHADVVVGPQFWNTTEIVQVDALLEKTASYF